MPDNPVVLTTQQAAAFVMACCGRYDFSKNARAPESKIHLEAALGRDALPTAQWAIFHRDTKARAAIKAFADYLEAVATAMRKVLDEQENDDGQA